MTDRRPSNVGLGTAPLGSQRDGPLWWGPQPRDQSIATVQAAIDAGVGFIDTAPFYGWGAAESIVGEAIAGLASVPPIFTKCGTVQRPDGSAGDDASPAAIRRDVEASLDRLGVPRLDVVQVHDPDPTTGIEVTWETLMDLVDEGLIGGAGLSNHPVDLMERALRVGPIAVVQHQYSLLWREPERDGVLDFCSTNDIPFLAWAPLASGFLVDGFDLDGLAPDDLRHGLPWAGRERSTTERLISLATEIAEATGCSVREVALAFLVGQDPPVRPIVGARRPEEAAALSSTLPTLTTDDRHHLVAALATDDEASPDQF